MSMEAPGYEHLAAVLQAAYDQAAKGKGAERHADNKPFHEQPMQTGSDMLGTDAGLAFQVIKKVREGRTFAEFERFEREMLGAINYIAGMVIWRRRQLPQPVEAPMTFAERVNEVDAEIQEHPKEDRRCPYCAAAEGSIHHPDCRLMRQGKTTLGQIVAAARAEVARRSLEAENQRVTPVPPSEGSFYHPDLVAAMRAQQPTFYPECGCPDNPEGIHYATCSRLTAPKEFVEQVEQTFDELETLASPADPTPVCGGCGREEGRKHRRGCPTLTSDDPFAGAPEWVKFKAQDGDGEWRWYGSRPTEGDIRWHDYGDGPRAANAAYGDPNPNWRDTLIERTSGQDPQE